MLLKWKKNHILVLYNIITQVIYSRVSICDETRNMIYLELRPFFHRRFIGKVSYLLMSILKGPRGDYNLETQLYLISLHIIVSNRGRKT